MHSKSAILQEAHGETVESLGTGLLVTEKIVF